MCKFRNQLKRVFIAPKRAFGIFLKRLRALNWNYYNELIREPKLLVDVNFQNKYLYEKDVEKLIDSQISNINVKTQEFLVDISHYKDIFNQLKRSKDYKYYYDLYCDAIHKKISEIYLTESLVKFKEKGIYIDIGSEFSIASDYFSKKYNCDVYCKIQMGLHKLMHFNSNKA